MINTTAHAARTPQPPSAPPSLRQKPATADEMLDPIDFLVEGTQRPNVGQRVVVGALVGGYGFMAASQALPSIATSLATAWSPAGAHLALCGVGAAVGYVTAGEGASTGKRVFGAFVGAAAAGAAAVCGDVPVVSRLVLGAVGGGLYGLTR